MIFFFQFRDSNNAFVAVALDAFPVFPVDRVLDLVEAIVAKYFRVNPIFRSQADLALDGYRGRGIAEELHIDGAVRGHAWDNFCFSKCGRSWPTPPPFVPCFHPEKIVRVGLQALY